MLLITAYFCMGTELRFLKQMKIEGFENFYQKFSSNVKIGIVGEQNKLEKIKEKGEFQCEIPIKFKKLLKAISKILKMDN